MKTSPPAVTTEPRIHTPGSLDGEDDVDLSLRLRRLEETGFIAGYATLLVAGPLRQ